MARLKVCKFGFNTVGDKVNNIGKEFNIHFVGAINEMLSCEDPSALQVILVGAGTFDAFVSLLQKTSVCSHC
jgi:hypothetical protein